MKFDSLRIAGWLGAAGVAFGALGAHALKPLLSPEALGVFQTGVNYHLLHTLALLAIGLQHNSSKHLLLASKLWFAGIVLFSGSLYFLAIRSLVGLEGLKWIGIITPLGGLCFIAGWIVIALFAQNKVNKF